MAKDTIVRQVEEPGPQEGMHHSPDSRPLTEADQLPESVEADLFELPTAEFERRYGVRSPAGQVLVESISAYDIPRISQETFRNMLDAASTVSSPENVKKVFASVRAYDRGERRVPVNALNRVTQTLKELNLVHLQLASPNVVEPDIQYRKARSITEAAEALKCLDLALQTGKDITTPTLEESD